MQKMTKLILALSVLAEVAFGAIGTEPVAALDFSFSFSSDDISYPAPTGVSGTVSGRILGLNDNQNNQMANQVIIDSFPAGLTGSLDNGMIATNWTNQVTNGFNVSGGNITAGVFRAVETSAGPGNFDFLCINNVTTNCRAFVNTPDDLVFVNGLTFLHTTSPNPGGARITANNSFGGVVFTPIPFEFESTLGLLALGGMFGASYYLKKRKAKKLAT